MNEQKYYEAVADEINLWNLDKRHNRYYQDMIRYDNIRKLIPDKSLCILDLGCGDGFLSFFLAQKQHRITSLDISQNRLDKFKQVSEKFNIKRVLGDVKNTGLPSQFFDIVVSSEVLEHIEGYEEVIREAWRLLKKNGLFIITVPNNEPTKIITCPYCLKSFYRDGHINRFNRANLPESLQKYNFQISRIKVLRSKILNQVQYHLKLKYGCAIKSLDRLLSFLFPKYTFYLLVVARKPAA